MQVWANNKTSAETENSFTKRTKTWEWGEQESHYLFAQDPDRARLALTLMDENVMADDEVLVRIREPEPSSSA